MEDRQPDTDGEHENDKGTALVVLPEDEPSLNDEATRGQPGFLQRLIYLFRPQSGSVRENLQDALAAHSSSDETISPEERAMLHNILLLQGMRVDDVMVPRAEIDAVDLQTPLGDLLRMFETSGHSRMPIFVETLDDPRGMVHIRDVMTYLINAGARKTRRKKPNGASKTNENGGRVSNSFAKIDLSKVDMTKTVEDLNLIRTVLFVPPSMLASDLMARMQAQRIQMALVIDEYGGTDGLVSLEDIVEVVFGNIDDEHDEVEVRIEAVGDNVYNVDARVELEELAEILGGDFVKAAQREDDDVDTIGGVIFSLLGRVPVRGEVIPSFAGYELEVLDADPRRIGRVKISRSRQAQKRRVPRRDAKTASKPEDVNKDE